VPVITCDGKGVVSHAETVLLAELADRVGLTAAQAEATDGLRERRAGHDPGRVMTRGGCWSMWRSRSRTARCRSVMCRCWLISRACTVQLAASPRPRRSGGCWPTPRTLLGCSRLARGELTGAELLGSRAAGKRIGQVVIDLDATLVTAHSQGRRKGNFKGGFGYHPLGAWLDNSNEALAAVLRPGNAGSNTAADHLTVVDQALAQLPDRWRSKPILIRADGAGYSHALISALSLQGLEFSVGYPVTDAIRTAITAMPKWAWQVASNADGDLREHADVVEVTGLLDLSKWTKDCSDMRVIVRRELPHPGATLDAFEIRDGYRYQAFTTNTTRGQLAFLEARHRAHARVEDRIRTGKDTGLGHLPSRHQNINEVWVELALIVADLLALAQSMLLTTEPELHRAEPKTLRYRLLHTAARIHPRTAQGVPAPGRALALGTRPGPSVHPPAADPAPGLTASTTTSNRPPRARRHRTQRRHSPLPAHPPHHSKIIRRRQRPLLKGRGKQSRQHLDST